jgi:NADPH2:quinone reductase
VLGSPLPPELAATFFVPATTAYVAVNDVAKVRPGEHVIVVGAAGAVGSMAAQQALAAGATVTGVVGRTEHLADVPKGVDAVDMTSPVAAAVLAETRSASLLIDTLGGDGLIGRTRWVHPGGRAVVIGYVAGPRAEINLPSWLLDDVALLPVNMIRQERRAREIAGELVGQLAAGELQVAVERFGIADTARALDALKSGRVRGRAVVIPGS